MRWTNIKLVVVIFGLVCVAAGSGAWLVGNILLSQYSTYELTYNETARSQYNLFDTMSKTGLMTVLFGGIVFIIGIFHEENEAQQKRGQTQYRPPHHQQYRHRMCPNCNSQLPKGVDFCPNCGTKILD